MRRLGCALAVSGWMVVGLGLAPGGAHAFSDVEVVNTTIDSGLKDNPNYCSGEGEGGEVCPLRAALESARETTGFNGQDIVVSVPEGHFLLTKGSLPLGNAQENACLKGEAKAKCPVTIQGAGAGRTVIESNGSSNVISTVESAAPVTIAGVTLRGGDAEAGGGIRAIEGEEVVLKESVVTKNTGGGIQAYLDFVRAIDSVISENGEVTYGGGVSVDHGGFEAIRSTISGNNALTEGGGIRLLTASALLIDSTLAGNVVYGSGGADSGGAIAAVGGGASVTLRYSTIANNTAPHDGGLYGGESVSIEGSILSGDSGGECGSIGKGEALGANIIFGTSSCVLTGPVPLGVNPKISSLSSNGGLGATIPLLRGSPAVNAGGSSCPTTDTGSGQVDGRRVRRPLGAACDLGSFESAADASVSLAATPDPATVGGSLVVTASVSDAGADPLTGVTVTVPVPAGATFVSAPAGCVAAFAGTTTVTCQVGSLSPGQVKPVAVTIRPEHAGALIETASVIADQADYNASNDSATLATVVASPSGQGPPPGSGTGIAGAAASALVGKILTIDAHGNVTLHVTCSAHATGGCPDTLALYGSTGVLPAAATTVHRRPAKATLLAHGHFNIQAGKTLTLHLHLNAAGLKLAKTHRSFPGRLLLSFHSATGTTTSHAYPVTLKRAVAKRHG